MAGNKATAGSEMNPFVVKVEFKDIKGPAIVHIPVREYKPGIDINILAYVKDESGVNRVEVHYRDENSAKFTKIVMNSISADKFSATIPTYGLQGKLSYFIIAEDKLGNVSYLPSSESPFVAVPSTVKMLFTKATDNQGPFVMYFPTEYYKPELGYQITLVADDETGVSKVILYYKTPNEKDYKSRYLRNFAPQSYGDFVAESSVMYYIVVTDFNQNVSMITSPNDPIVMANGKRVSGKWQYLTGS